MKKQNELWNKKTQAEEEIKDILLKFSIETGLKVESIDVDLRTKVDENQKCYGEYHVKIDAKLEG